MSDTELSTLYSIVIPAYNSCRFLQATLNSIYAQTYKNIEIIVVDDGSTDGTPELLAAQEEPRLRVFRQTNQGVSVARNRGIREAKGEFVAFVDADDCWKVNHLEIVNIFFESYPEYNWFVASYQSVSDISEEMIHNVENCLPSYRAVNWFLSANRVPMSGNYVMKKSTIPHDSLFPLGVVMCEDNVACARMAMENPMIGTTDYVTVYYRMHSTSASHVYSFSALGRTSLIKKAFLIHQDMFSRNDCLAEARLFFRFYSLLNWWIRIRSCSMLSWRKEIEERSVVLGSILSKWLVISCFLSDFFCRFVAKIIRFEINKIERKMKKLENVYSKKL